MYETLGDAVVTRAVPSGQTRRRPYCMADNLLWPKRRFFKASGTDSEGGASILNWVF